MRNNLVIRNQKGFTLIEIIAVLVILGLLAVVAVPKFIDLQTQAREKSADGVWGAANSVSSLNFAKGVLDPTNSTPVSTGQHLLDGMDSTPQGWSASGATITDGTYTITVTTAEVEGVSRAVLSKSW
ncbi:MAG: prepilin-type N-terminal cleavage/methylation domain-containing protein [Pseudomonadota bacterium]